MEAGDVMPEEEGEGCAADLPRATPRRTRGWAVPVARHGLSFPYAPTRDGYRIRLGGQWYYFTAEGFEKQCERKMIAKDIIQWNPGA